MQRAPKQEPSCGCCGAPIEPIRWDGTIRPVLYAGDCAYCGQPLPCDRMQWHPDDAFQILLDMAPYKRFDARPGVVLMAYGVPLRHG